MGVSSFGEYSIVPEDNLVLVREDAPLDKLALIGCGVPTGVGAVIHTAKVKPGSRVVVIGVGGVGLNVVQGAVPGGSKGNHRRGHQGPQAPTCDGIRREHI